MTGFAAAIAAAGVIAFIAAMVAWWKMINADAEGIDPTNDIRELNREDGGRGPIP